MAQRTLAVIMAGGMGERLRPLTDIRTNAGWSGLMAGPRYRSADPHIASRTDQSPAHRRGRDLYDQLSEAHQFRAESRNWCGTLASSRAVRRCQAWAVTDGRGTPDSARSTEWKERNMPKVSKATASSHMVVPGYMDTCEQEIGDWNVSIQSNGTSLEVYAQRARLRAARRFPAPG